MNKSHYRFVLIVSAVFVLFSIIVGCYSKLSGNPERISVEYRGAVLSHVHETGSGYGSKHFKVIHPHLKKVGYDTVQINTFGFINDLKDTTIVTKGDPTLTMASVESEIEKLKESGFKVMLKPHIWTAWWKFDHDTWNEMDYSRDPRNKINFKDPAQRAQWFSSYSDFVILQAELAEKTGVDIFVIGSELVKMSQYTDYWEDLIERVREVYGGKITYAAEGLNAFKIEFWDKLDYIGIDVYFTLCRKTDTTIANLLKGWSEIEPKIKSLSKKYDKKVIFTEIGYQSVEGTAKKPWEWVKKGNMSEQEQALAFEAMFTAFQYKPYMAGVFVWQYLTDLEIYEQEEIKRGFTPYGKKAEIVISTWFERSE